MRWLLQFKGILLFTLLSVPWEDLAPFPKKTTDSLSMLHSAVLSSGAGENPVPVYSPRKVRAQGCFSLL